MIRRLGSVYWSTSGRMFVAPGVKDSHPPLPPPPPPPPVIRGRDYAPTSM